MAGQTWPQALEAAKAAGFRAKVPRLIRFVQGAKPARKPVRKAARKARASKAAAPTVASDLKALEATLGKMVQDRVRAVLDDAIAVLQRAKDRV